MKVLAATLAAGVLAALPLVAAASTPQEPGAVFECSTRDGRTVFSDEPCVGASRVRVWTPRSGAPGIVRSSVAAPSGGAPAALAASAMAQGARGNGTAQYGPYVDCQRRGGRYEPAARICRLPDDAARQMFGATR